MNDSTMPPEERRNMNDSTMPPPPPRTTATKTKKSSITSSSSGQKSPTRVRSIGGGFGPPPPSRARNKMGKAPLAKGFGLHDWALLTKQAKDLAQRKGAPLRQKIPLSELAQHNQVYDGWCALKGKVYNIGPYLPYHPGGERIMHKVLGKDASQLFDKYHPWVNIDGYVTLRSFLRIIESSFWIMSFLFCLWGRENNVRLGCIFCVVPTGAMFVLDSYLLNLFLSLLTFPMIRQM